MSKPSWSLGVLIAVTAACGGGTTPKPAAAPPEPGPPPVRQPLAATPAEAPLPSIPTSPVTAPAELVATAVWPAPATLLPTVASFAERASPGLGATITAEGLRETATALGLDLRGVDLSRPVRALLLDPSRFSQPLVVVVGVGDEAALAAAAAQRGARYQIHDGHAAIGAEPALIAAGGYALTALRATPVPPVATADIDVGYLMLHHGELLAELVGQGEPDEDPATRAARETLTHGALALLRQLDHVQISAGVVGDRASGTIRLQPKTGTGLATFVARQVPATFAQVGRVPGGVLTIGGRLVVSEVVADATTTLAPLAATVYGGAAPGVLGAWQRLAKVELGEFASTSDLTDGAMLAAVDDPKLAARAWAEATAAQVAAARGPVVAKATTVTYRGVKLASLVTAASKTATAEQRAALDELGPRASVFGVVGDTLILTAGADALARARPLVDLVRLGARAPAPPPGLVVGLEEARRRRASLIVAVDVNGLATAAGVRAPAAIPPAGPVAEAAVLEVSFDDGAMTLRATVPLVQVQGALALDDADRAAEVSEADAVIDRFDRLADRLCACRDQPCIQAVLDELSRMEEPAGRPNQEQMNRAMAIAGRMGECQRKLMAATPSP